jgi:hypothetical protein
MGGWAGLAPSASQDVVVKKKIVALAGYRTAVYQLITRRFLV